MNCDHCGCLLPQKYAPNCGQCGAQRKYVVRDLPLRVVTKGTRPPPKPLPAPDPGQPIDGDLIYTYDWGWKVGDLVPIIMIVGLLVILYFSLSGG